MSLPLQLKKLKAENKHVKDCMNIKNQQKCETCNFVADSKSKRKKNVNYKVTIPVLVLLNLFCYLGCQLYVLNKYNYLCLNII